MKCVRSLLVRFAVAGLALRGEFQAGTPPSMRQRMPRTRRREIGHSLRLLSIIATALALMWVNVLQANPPAQPGVVVSWGGQSIPFSFYDGQRTLKIAAGEVHSLALKSDGTVLAWGDNTYGECPGST